MTETVPTPVALLAELTHRCPLKCPYCSNPVELIRRKSELDTRAWIEIFQQAAAMGVLQVHLSGGEPASRKDLEEITEGARKTGLYTNLITSGVGLTQARLRKLAGYGLDHVQLSIQGAHARLADEIGGYRGGFDTKMQVADWVTELGLPLTVNAVMHRRNLDHIEETIALAHRLGARRLEIAHTQYHGWAYRNRSVLMPTFEQVERAAQVVTLERERLTGKMVIDYVPPDHLGKYPKPCMGGWGRMGLCITPSGKVLPCHAAETISTLAFETIHDRPLAEIWADGPAFTAYRGTAWMPEPCKSCERQTHDWGGCRCQAFSYTGEAGVTDPVCSKSPIHDILHDRMTDESAKINTDLIYRSFGTSQIRG